MKLSDFTRPALCAPAVSAAVFAVVSSAYVHACPISLESAPNAIGVAPDQSTIHFSAPLEAATYAFTVQ